MKTLESMNYREQDFDRCENCKYITFGYEGECECKKIKGKQSNRLPVWNYISQAGICDEHERRTE
jgi:hypothetical protein